MLDRKHIVLAEDDPDHRTLTVSALRAHGVTSPVTTALDGHDALRCLFGERATRRDGRIVPPDLLLLDLGLPDVNSLHVLRQLRDDRRTRAVPVVVLTEQDREEHLFESYRHGANNYVRKRVEPEEYTAVVGEVCLHWLRMKDTIARIAVLESPALLFREGNGPFTLSTLAAGWERLDAALSGPRVVRHTLLSVATGLVILSEHLEPIVADRRAMQSSHDEENGRLQAGIESMRRFLQWMRQHAHTVPADVVAEQVAVARDTVGSMLRMLRGH